MNQPLYTIRHHRDDNGQRSENWTIYCGDKWIFHYRAKSRSKVETQELLDHVNKTIEENRQ